MESSEDHKFKCINYETECAITKISTNDVRSVENILQMKIRSESCTCEAIDREDNATLEINLKCEDNVHLTNLSNFKIETVSHDDDKKIPEILEENKIKFINNETELFSLTKTVTNGSSENKNQFCPESVL